MACRSGDARARCRRARGPRRATVGGLAVAGMLATAGVAACADDGDEFEWPDDPPTQESAAPVAGEEETVARLRTLVDEFRRVQVEVFAEPAPAHEVEESFVDYVADPLLNVTMLDIELMHRQGLVREGEPVREARVVEVDQETTPPTATIRECLDTTGWLVVDPATGQPAEVDGLAAWFAPGEYVAEFEASMSDDGWLLRDARVEERDTPVEEDGQC